VSIYEYLLEWESLTNVKKSQPNLI
jgi:hypothetical protein